MLNRTIASSLLLLIMVVVSPSVLAADPPATPVQSAASILSAARPAAVDQIVRATRSDNIRVRVNAIEASRNLPDRVSGIIETAARDKHEAVRFAALVIAGQLRLNDLEETIALRLEDPSPSVRGSAIFAARMTGKKIDPTPLAQMLTGRNPTERSNAAMLLGLMGDKSAVPMLVELANAPTGKQDAQHEKVFRLQVAEAVTRLLDGDRNDIEDDTYEQSLGSLRSAAWSNHNEGRVFAITMLGHLGDKRYYHGIQSFVYEVPDPKNRPDQHWAIELRLAAAEYTARVGTPVGRDVVHAATASPAAPVRAQAAMVLGLYNDAASAQKLTAMLKDQSELVRVSAAAAALGNSKRSVASR